MIHTTSDTCIYIYIQMCVCVCAFIRWIGLKEHLEARNWFT